MPSPVPTKAVWSASSWAAWQWRSASFRCAATTRPLDPHPLASGAVSHVDLDHPRHTEAISAHTEGGREESLAEWHLNLATLGEPIEDTLGLTRVGRRVVDAHAVGGAVEVPGGIVGAHQQLVTCLQCRVHDEVGLGGGRRRPGVGGHIGHPQQNELSAEDLLVA